MEIIYRYNIKEGKQNEFVDFVAKNEHVLRERAAEGWTFLGTYLTVQGLGDYDVEQRWQIDDYARLGSGWGHDEEFDRVIRESLGFMDGRFVAQVVKSVDEVMVLAGT